MPLRKPTKALPTMAEAEIAIVRIAPETSFKNKAYEALKEAILKMDIYATPEPVMLDERALSERLGVSRTPIREAIAMLEQDGFVKTVPRRGIVVVRRTKSEIVDMIRAWAALESMAARLITTTARKKDISALARFFQEFRQGSPAAGPRRGIFEGQHRLSPGADLAQRVADADRHDQRHPAACSRLPAADDRARRTAPRYRCPSTWPSSKRSKSAIPSLRKSVRAITRSALPPMSKPTDKNCSS